jgi:hypothetical protein
MAKKALDERQKLFLEHLFGDEAQGSAAKAKVLAGYSPDYATSALVESLKEEIVEATKSFLSQNAPKAAIAIISGIDSPTQLGLKEKLSSAKDILDRIGVVKTEKMEVNSTGVFFLPAKTPPTEEESDD